MKPYFKAVQLDGTDFRTGTVDYASLAETGNPLPVLGGGKCCTGGVYHASTVASDTLIGGKWPCRLFKVYGVPVSQEENKRGFRTLFVGKEIPAWKALGPNGQKVAALIERAKTLTQEEAIALDAAWDAAWGAAWDAAWGAAWGAARGAAYAADALLVEDLIGTGNFTQEHFDMFYGPWKSVIG